MTYETGIARPPGRGAMTSPPPKPRARCSGVSNMRHPSPEVRESCLKFMKQTDAFVQKMHAEGLFDAALFENIKECIDLW